MKWEQKWKKLKYEEVHIGMIVYQYPNDPIPMVVKEKNDEYIIARCDELFGYKFKAKGFGKPFNELYIKEKWEELNLLEL